MACCVKIQPESVQQWEGQYYTQVGDGGLEYPYQRVWWWYPSQPESDFDADEDIAIQYRKLYADAFDTMEHPCLAEYPDELKNGGSAHSIHEGEQTLTFRAEFTDSADCGDDETETGYGEGCQIVLKLIVCSPITLKAAAIGLVSEYGQTRPSGSVFTPNYQAFDRMTVSVSRRLAAIGDCDETVDPYNETGYQTIICGHESTGGSSCDMLERSDCETVFLCEGEYYLSIYMATGDGHQHVGAYWEVELTFACGQDSLDCDTEQELDSYLPCDRTYTPCDPPADPSDPQPGECGGGQVPNIEGTCFCSTCVINAVEITLSGLTNSSCSPPDQAFESRAANANGSYVAVRTDTTFFEAHLGTQDDCGDRGILIAENNFISADVLCKTYLWKITGTLGCTGDTPEVIEWEFAPAFFYQTFIEGVLTPCAPYPFPCGNEFFPSTCSNIVFLNEIESIPGCDGSVTYSNDNNYEYNLTIDPYCECVPVASEATMKVRVLGYAGCPG